MRATRPSDPLAPDAVRSYVKFGASVRATMYLVLAAKARALLQGRYHVTAADLAALALPVLRHRVLTNYQAESHGKSVDDVLRALLAARRMTAPEERMQRTQEATHAETAALAAAAARGAVGALRTSTLAARAAVEGTLVGLHRSPQFGFSQEFAEYRAYMRGR